MNEYMPGLVRGTLAHGVILDVFALRKRHRMSASALQLLLSAALANFIRGILSGKTEAR